MNRKTYSPKTPVFCSFQLLISSEVDISEGVRRDLLIREGIGCSSKYEILGQSLCPRSKFTQVSPHRHIFLPGYSTLYSQFTILVEKMKLVKKSYPCAKHGHKSTEIDIHPSKCTSAKSIEQMSFSKIYTLRP